MVVNRYITNFHRYWWILLAPIMFMPIALALTIAPSPSYTTQASLWVEHTIYYDTTKPLNLDNLDTAAETHSQLLNSLLTSPNFLKDVVSNIEGGGYQVFPNIRFLLKGQPTAGFKVTSLGNSLVLIECTGNNATFNKEISKSIVNTYNNFLNNLVRTQGKSMLEYMSSQLEDLKGESDKIDAEVTKYIESNPGSGENDPAGTLPFLSSEDVSKNILLENQSQIHQRYDTLQTDLEQLQTSYDTIISNQQTSFFKVKDEPAVVDSSIYDQTTRLILGSLVGLGGGLLLGLVALLIITQADTSLGEEEFARNYLGLKFAVSLTTSNFKNELAGKRKRFSNKLFVKSGFRRILLIGLALLGLILFTVIQSRYYPANGMVVPFIALLVVIIYQWPVTGYFITLFIALVSELFTVPDFISAYTILPLTNINSFTTIPLSATPQELIIAATIISLMLKTIPYGKRLLDRSKTALQVGLLGGFILFSFVYGVFLKHGDFKAAQWEVRGLVYIVVIYFLTVYFMHDPRYWRTLNWLLPAGLALLSAIVIWRFFVVPENTNEYMYTESLSGFNHDTAILLVILVMWCITKLLFRGSGIEKFWACILIAPAVFSIMVSGRRAAFASLAVSLIICLAVMFFRQRKLFIITTILLVLFVPPYLVIFKNASGPLGLAARAFSSSTAAVGSRDYSSDLYRVVEKDNVQLTIKSSALTTLTGIGFGQMFTRYNTMISLDNFTFQYFTPHIQVLWLWLKLGVVGWMLFWLIMCSALFKLGQLIKYSHFGPRLSLSIIAGCIISAILIYAYVDVSLTDQRLTTLLAVSIGLLEIAYRTLRQPTQTAQLETSSHYGTNPDYVSLDQLESV